MRPSRPLLSLPLLALLALQPLPGRADQPAGNQTLGNQTADMATSDLATDDLTPTLTQHIQPGYAGFASATLALQQASAASCDVQTLRPAFTAAWDAWMAVAHLHFGPSEEQGRALAILFWPDPKGLGAKAQRGLLTGDAAALTPEAFADQSVAARGLAGLERLLYAEKPPEADPCPLIRATAADLARMAAEISAGWQGDTGYGATLLSAGQPGNSRYLSQKEARQAVFTQLISGLEFLADTRIGRPLGSFERPRPERAEARLSGRAARNVLLSLQAMKAMALTLDPAARQTAKAFDHAIDLAQRLNDPDFQLISQPQPWLKLQILQQAVRASREAAVQEIAPVLGVTLGFNSLDGD